MIRLAILASGSGSNAEKIMEHFQHSSKAEIALVASNKADAFVLQRAGKFGVPTFTFTRKEMDAGLLLEKLIAEKIDWVILAGFLLKIPDELTQAFPDHMVNIHPALLPKYGGKGMYGGFVHEAVNIKNTQDYTRYWFAWANGYFGELILDIKNRFPHLLKK